MISTAFALASAALAMQPVDMSRASGEAFTRCLRTFVERALSERMVPSRFNGEFPTACSAEEDAFHAAVFARETREHMSRADAEESAGLEIDDARTSAADRFAMAQPVPR